MRLVNVGFELLDMIMQGLQYDYCKTVLSNKYQLTQADWRQLIDAMRLID